MKFKGTTKEIPFGSEYLVFKVMGKMFAAVAWEEQTLRITLKSDPEQALILRTQYAAIVPGYLINKKHWNTITLDVSEPEDLLRETIQDSYSLVVKGLKKTDRKALEEE